MPLFQEMSSFSDSAGVSLSEAFAAACAAGDSTEMVRLVRLLVKEDFTAALGLVGELSTGWQQRRMCLLACAELNPVALAGWVVEHMPVGGDRTYALHVALWNWVDLDPEAAASWCAALTAGQSREFGLRTVFDAWARKDPVSAAAGLFGPENFDTRHLAADSVSRCWATIDLHAATAWAWNLSEGRVRDRALAGVVRHLVQVGEINADDGRPGAVRDETLQSMASLLGVSSTEQLARALNEQVDASSAPDPAFQIHLARWVKQDPDAAAAWAAQLADTRARGKMLSAIARLLARTDPPGAAAIAGQISGSVGRSNALHAIAFYWARQKAETAREWAETIDDEEIREVALAEIEAIAEEASAHMEPETAAVEPEVSDTGLEPEPDETASPEDPAESPESEPGDTGELEENDPRDPPEDVQEFSWAELWEVVVQLPDGDMRNGLAHRAVALQAQAGEPEAAIVMATEQLSDQRLCDTAIRAAISAWVSADTNAPTVWARSLPAGHRREHALFSLVLSMVDTFPHEAGNIALDLEPDTDARRNAISLVAFRWGRVSSSRATGWALKLADSAERELALSKIN